MTEKHPHTNRLIHEKSPYLLQHAHNPVDWYPWGNEAFQTAQDHDKPIFLSIGYATCHWCHQMEKESFEDPEIAKQMNEAFVNIKVDREELPEVDSLYMEFAQTMMTGAAGWPLNVILTPDLTPFFATTYLPPQAAYGMMGMPDLISRIQLIWDGEEREAVVAQAEHIVEVFRQNVHIKGDMLPEKESISRAAEMLFKMADPVYGGIKGAPKFPIGYQGNFLLNYNAAFRDSRALFLVERTLDMMQRGGIYDHLGGGFSRYSVDEKWHVPHFEKMLYDNALLARTYLALWKVDQSDFYRRISEETLHYALREMLSPEGAFYSAEDADSEGVEGKFYTWTPAEVLEVLGAEEGLLFCDYYNVTEEGNLEGRSVLSLTERIESFAAAQHLDPIVLEELIRRQKQKLFQEREKRVRPFKDDKVLCSWNGLMITALAEAGFTFQNREFLNAALRAAQFLKKNMWREGRLYRRWREGELSFSAGLEDYAFTIQASLALFEAGCGSEWLVWAIELTHVLSLSFKEKDGAFYQTEAIEENLLIRKSQFADGAEPSGNAVHCENLLKLYQITFDPNYWIQAEDILKAVKRYIDTHPPGYTYHMMNLIRFYDGNAPTLIIALNEGREYETELRHLLSHQFLPHKSIVWREPEEERLLQAIPHLQQQGPIGGKTTLYLCRRGVCQKPLTTLTEMLEAVRSLNSF